MKLKTALIIVFLFSAAMPAFAAAKSVSVQVSCNIPAMIEIAAPIAQAVTVRSNLSNQYQMTEDIGLRDGQSVKLFSLTAL